MCNNKTKTKQDYLYQYSWNSFALKYTHAIGSWDYKGVDLINKTSGGKKLNNTIAGVYHI